MYVYLWFAAVVVWLRWDYCVVQPTFPGSRYRLDITTPAIRWLIVTLLPALLRCPVTVDSDPALIWTGYGLRPHYIYTQRYTLVIGYVPVTPLPSLT